MEFKNVTTHYMNGQHDGVRVCRIDNSPMQVIVVANKNFWTFAVMFLADSAHFTPGYVKLRESLLKSGEPLDIMRK